MGDVDLRTSPIVDFLFQPASLDLQFGVRRFGRGGAPVVHRHLVATDLPSIARVKAGPAVLQRPAIRLLLKERHRPIEFYWTKPAVSEGSLS
jgi:hypothetical protein